MCVENGVPAWGACGVERLSHQQPKLSGMRSGELQHGAEQCIMHALDNVPGGHLGVDHADDKPRSSLHGVRLWDVFKHAERELVREPLDVRSRQRTTCVGHGVDGHAVRFLRGRNLLRRRHHAESHVRGRYLGPRPKQRHGMRHENHLHAWAVRDIGRLHHARPLLSGVRPQLVFHHQQRFVVHGVV